MCLIAVKPSGVNLPDDDDLGRWYLDHADGAGLAFTDINHRVHILKGAMSLKDFYIMHSKMLDLLHPLKPREANIMYHFRQATGGAIEPRNCHPFPITKNTQKLAALDLITDRAIAHNGIIWDYEKDCYSYGGGDTYYWNNAKPENKTTDTQRFIVDCLADMGDAIHNKGVGKLIARYTQSRFAVMDGVGITLIGKFIKDKEMYYSNTGYKETAPAAFMPAAPAKDQAKTGLDWGKFYQNPGIISRKEKDGSWQEGAYCEMCNEFTLEDELTHDFSSDLYVCPACAEACAADDVGETIQLKIK